MSQSTGITCLAVKDQKAERWQRTQVVALFEGQPKIASMIAPIMAMSNDAI
jgi:hypothetical protein